MKVEIKNHLLYIDDKQVAFKKSPNISSSKNHLQYLIEHYTATYGSASPISWLTDKASEVSAHLVIAKDGTVTQLAPFDAVCWHAGKSEWKGINGMNNYAIGIEIVNSGILSKKADGFYSADGHKVEQYKELTNKLGLKATWELYPDVQIETVAAISKALVSHYGLKEIVGHEDVSPGRKTDPGPAFPWDKIRNSSPVQSIVTKTTTVSVNLRETADLHGTILKVLPKDKQVEVIMDATSWTLVKVDGLKGYVYNQYLK